MYLKKLSIEHFRKFGDADNTIQFAASKDYKAEKYLNIAPKTTLIVGKNNSGKTTIVEVLRRLLEQTDFRATRNIRAAAAAAGVEYHRLLRSASPLPTGSVVLADAAQAAAYLADRPGRVLLATGAKELPAFAALDPARLYPRVLPTLAGIAACEAAGIPHRNILAMQGPFTKELNAALLHQFHIDYMVTKDGGAAGGFAEKAEAAARCGVQLIVLRRPDDEGETADTILQRCRELL